MTRPRSAVRSDLALLRQVGEALYGRTWQTELAAGLDVSVRQVQRFAAGAAVAPAHWARLGNLLAHRALVIARLEKEIVAAATPAKAPGG